MEESIPAGSVKFKETGNLLTGKFTTATDVSDIDALVQKALAYKADPYKDSQLGIKKRIGLLFLKNFFKKTVLL